jgi:cytochrome c553
MTIKKTAFAIALLALALTACKGGGEEGHAEEGHEGEAPKSSSAGLPSGNIEAGMKLATTKRAGFACVDCHGAEGNAPTDKSYPKLGGQYSDYIEHALLAYRKGDRDNSLMSPQAKELTDQQIADLGAYFHSTQTHLYDLHNAQ